ncbi:MAG TPA: carbon monoxide dehydrogenase subunit G [Micromonosporaceae bacterium]|nr:carbon monoxide dehydrogenase subunit G [Micromonosporaceae bacterium]
MKLSGQATLHGPVDRVYQALNDPAVLVRTIPGCEKLETVGPDAYRMTVTAGVASIKGTYVGDVRLTGQDAPHTFTMHAAGSGAPGTISADVTVRLSDGEDGTTLLAYDADAVVGGMIGGVGQRMLTGVMRKTAGEFFAAVDGVLTGDEAAAPAPVSVPASVPASQPQEGSPVPVQAGIREPFGGGQRTVFTRPAGSTAPAGVLPTGFLAGALVGAAIALAGAVVGGLLTRRGAGRRADPGAGRGADPGT